MAVETIRIHNYKSNYLNEFNNVNIKKIKMDEYLKMTINIVTSINSILSSIIFSSFLLYKNYLSKQDILIGQKYFFQFLFFVSYLCISVINSSNNDEQLKHMNPIIFTYYLIFLYIITFAITYENYISLRDPSHVLRILIKKSNNYIYVDIFIIIIILFFFSLFTTKYIEPKNNYDVSNNLGLCILLVIISFLMTLFYFLNRKNYPSFEIKSQRMIFFVNKFYLGINLSYFLYAVFLLVHSIFYYIKAHNILTQVDFEMITKCAIYFIGLEDCFFFMGIIYNSSFYYYTLGNYYLGAMYFCFGCKRYNMIDSNSDKSDDFESISKDYSYKTSDTTYFMMNLYNNIGYIVDDYIVEMFDYIVNIGLLSMNEMYNCYYLDKPYIKNTQQNSITITKTNTALLSDSNLLVNNNPSNKLVFNKDTLLYSFNQSNKMKVNSTVDIFFRKIQNLSVEIESLYTTQIRNLIEKYNISIPSISTSLLSNKFTSLLSKNVKENHYFKSLQSLVLKTYDKHLLIEIHNGNIIDEKMNLLLERYFQYLSEKTDNTFLPVLVGIFKIKINRFREILFFVSINPLVENIPSQFYNFWQLMKFKSNSKNFEKVCSSKDKDTFVITTELIFEKNKKFKISDFEHFKGIFNEDLQFLKSAHSYNFSLMILYYELDLNNNNENKLGEEENDQKIELIFEIEEGMMTNSRTVNYLQNGNEDDTKIEGVLKEYSDNNQENDAETLCLSNISSESLSKNGFNCVFGNFKGIVFFSFDNIFNVGGVFTKTTNFYKGYFKDVLEYFEWK